MAMDAAMEAKNEWESLPWATRASLFMSIASLISGKYRYLMNASTMLGQSKNAFQAEIDAPCEVVDFLRFGVYYADQIYRQQPEASPEGEALNRLVYRPLEGFVLAVSPFNFTALGANLSTAPAIMGNTVVWKPATTSLLSNYYFMRILTEAGLPAGVINFVPCRGADIGRYVANDSRMAGFHFTGSTEVFRSVWKRIGENIDNYYSYPRLVGETGGKGFLFAHKSADISALISALVRGAFEYSGQKCSALSRAFIPVSIWAQVKERLLKETAKLRAGDVEDFSNFLNAVIDKTSFDKLTKCIDEAKASPDAEVLCGGYDGSVGYFIYPAIIQAKKKEYPTMLEELFGPVLSIYVYDDNDIEEMLKYCDKSTPYALTGSVFAQDRTALAFMESKLLNAAGVFYINDKPTGAVVGQHPFGGSRSSGTNEKTSHPQNLSRWTTAVSVKERITLEEGISYPFMAEK